MTLLMHVAVSTLFNESLFVTNRIEIICSLFACSPAGPAEPGSSEGVRDDGQELVPPPAGEGRPGFTAEERRQTQTLRQRARGTD